MSDLSDDTSELDARAREFEPPPPMTGGRKGHVIMGLTALAIVFAWGGALVGPFVPFLPFPFIAVLTVLPWVALVLVVWTFALWTVLPDHPAGIWLTTATVALPLLQWGTAWPDRGVADAQGVELGVTSWNVRRLWGGPDDGGDPTACVVAHLREQASDVVVLQEVTQQDLDALSSQLSLDCLHATYRDADAPTASGMAICTQGTRWTITEAKTRAFGPAIDWRYLFTEITSRTPSDDPAVVNVLGVHLHPYRILHDPLGAMSDATTRAPIAAHAQQAQTQALLSRASRLHDPSILAGDFNSTRDTPLHARIRRYLVDTWERGAMGTIGTVDLIGFLSLRIDYVYATPDLVVVDADVPDAGCSDHRPVVSKLVVPSAASR